MRRYTKYISYVLRHKWFVCLAGVKVGCSPWRLMVHDASKFRLKELIPYAKTFYHKDGTSRYKPSDEFHMAWLNHQRRNPHHWQHWILRMDGGTIEYIKMPRKYMKEMVADWMGAGRAIAGKWEYQNWYIRNRHNIELHPETRQEVERLLGL